MTGVEEARAAFASRQWVAARERYAAAAGEAVPSGVDLAQWSEATWWVGLADESRELAERAYAAYLDERNQPRAAYTAFDVAYAYFLKGDEARGGGWLGRAERLLADQPECVEHGYLRYFRVEGLLAGDDHEATLEAARDVQAFAERHGDRTLVAAGVVAEGRALVRLGRTREGLAALDDAMLLVSKGDLAPAFTGNVYCHLMAACHELGDLRRAGAWTQATSVWCDQVAPAVLFKGICRVHRAQLLQTLGDWDESEREARLVCESVATFSAAVTGEGFYQCGEILRLRGDLPGAEAAYVRGHALGRDPQPGLALLRLAQGRPTDAAASMNTALAAVPNDRLGRARLLPAQVEIAIAGDDLTTATKAAAELAGIAATFQSSGLTSAALTARGVVLLARGEVGDALPVLRSALTSWLAVDATYDAAKVRCRLAEAYRAMGDEDLARLEILAAEAVFAKLGVRRTYPDGLSAREVEVLSLVAAGRSNQEIADSLVLSRKTVARHLENIFAKLQVSTRTAAAAYAFRHGLAG